MNFVDCIKTRSSILMEGALGERLKREYQLTFHQQVAMASLIYEKEKAAALKKLWNGYGDIARKYRLPLLVTTPTRRANKERVLSAGYDGSIITDNVNFLRSIEKESQAEMYIGGLMGCKGDAYTGEGALSETEARDFHL